MVNPPSGGTVLSNLLASEDSAIRDSVISVLVRGKEQARRLESKGVRVLMFEGFDEDVFIQQTAAEFDGKLKRSSQAAMIRPETWYSCRTHCVRLPYRLCKVAHPGSS